MTEPAVSPLVGPNWFSEIPQATVAAWTLRHGKERPGAHAIVLLRVLTKWQGYHLLLSRQHVCTTGA